MDREHGGSRSNAASSAPWARSKTRPRCPHPCAPRDALLRARRAERPSPTFAPSASAAISAFAANLAAVEIECSDCHGTPEAYPWELPLGWGDENEPGPAQGEERGVAGDLPEMLRMGKVYPKQDGYLRTARGNPMPDVVRDGSEVIVHTAGGRDLRLAPLEAMATGETLDVSARVAMVHVDEHVETMECYSCHTQWAPQCYGCHIEVDYSSEEKGFDWTAAGNLHRQPHRRTDPDERGYPVEVPGEVTEMRSYMRWADPPLGMNGEGRVSPVIPGCQTTVTVIGPDGEEVVRNRIFRTPSGTEGGGEEGQLGIDMSPVHPHTVGPARSCESCHASDKALGYGIGGGELNPPWSRPKVVDLTTADGRVLPRSARPQIEPIGGLDFDWSALVTPEGQQLQTVGHHWLGSGPLSNQQRTHMTREGVCVSCHQEIPNESLAVSALHHVAETSGAVPHSVDEHGQVVHGLALTPAWAQLGGAVGGVMVSGLVIVWGVRRRRRRRDGEDRKPQA